MENQLLERLANAPDDILSDVALIEGLETTKKTATEIEEAVKKGREMQLSTTKARNQYMPVASEAAMLYFMIIQVRPETVSFSLLYIFNRTIVAMKCRE